MHVFWYLLFKSLRKSGTNMEHNATCLQIRGHAARQMSSELWICK